MNRDSEMIKIAAAAVAYEHLTGQQLPKYAAGGLAGLLGLAPKKSSVLKWLLPLLGVGGAGALAYTQKDKIGDLISGLTSGGGGSEPTGSNPPLNTKRSGGKSQGFLDSILGSAPDTIAKRVAGNIPSPEGTGHRVAGDRGGPGMGPGGSRSSTAKDIMNSGSPFPQQTRRAIQEGVNVFPQSDPEKNDIMMMIRNALGGASGVDINAIMAQLLAALKGSGVESRSRNLENSSGAEKYRP
jgi:hypothetical protein